MLLYLGSPFPYRTNLCPCLFSSWWGVGVLTSTAKQTEERGALIWLGLQWEREEEEELLHQLERPHLISSLTPSPLLTDPSPRKHSPASNRTYGVKRENTKGERPQKVQRSWGQRAPQRNWRHRRLLEGSPFVRHLPSPSPVCHLQSRPLALPSARMQDPSAPEPAAQCLGSRETFWGPWRDRTLCRRLL